MRNKKVFSALFICLGVLALVAGVYNLAAGFDSALFWAIVAVIGAAVTAAFSASIIKAKEKPFTSAKYARKPSIISRCEYDFLQLLRQIEPGKYEVIPQAALVSVIDKRTETAYRNELFRIADFLFVDKNTFAPLLLVELNDASHLKADRQMRDKKVAEIWEKAKMPLVTFWTNGQNDYPSVKRTILKNILKK